MCQCRYVWNHDTRDEKLMQRGDKQDGCNLASIQPLTVRLRMAAQVNDLGNHLFSQPQTRALSSNLRHASGSLVCWTVILIPSVVGCQLAIFLFQFIGPNRQQSVQLVNYKCNSNQKVSPVALQQY